ncbi:MAG: FHIPEP family type III secretion protein, partial [Halobacteriovoraceae bacterium]|nr:FHIPEP family type III secretion protein [Halobacteriovoraceae bacterium]
FKIHPKAIYMASAVLFVFSAVPGLPKFPFMTIGLALGFLAYRMEKIREKENIAVKEQEIVDQKTTPENLEDLLPLELVELEVGYGLVELVDADQKGDLLERITHLRKQFALDWGVIIPSIRIIDNLELKPGGYSIKIKGVDVASGELLSDHFLAMDPGQIIEKIQGIETTEPVFGLPAVWITEDQKDDALYNGYTVVDLSTIMATHITEVLKGNLSELLGREELVKILDNFKEINPKLVGDLIPDILSIGVVLKVVQNLLREGVSVRDLRSILEALAEHGEKNKEPDTLTELSRQSLYRTITESIKSNQGDVPLFTLDGKVDQLLNESIVQTDHGKQLSLDPQTTQSILANLNEKIEEATNMGEKMVVLCNSNIRSAFKKMTEKFIPNLVVITHNELNPDINVRSIGTVRL